MIVTVYVASQWCDCVDVCAAVCTWCESVVIVFTWCDCVDVV